MAFLWRCRQKQIVLPGGISPEQMNNYEYVNADGSGDPKGTALSRWRAHAPH